MNKVPEEVLQWIFQIFCCNDEDERTHDSLHLRRLCSIDRRWRLASITHRPLWTTLPRIDFNDKKIEHMRRAVTGVQLYLSRSGSLPISFAFLASKRPGSTLRRAEQKADPAWVLLKLLIEQSHRWDRVVLKLPSFGLDHLRESLKGPLPFLSSLDIAFISSSVGDTWDRGRGLDALCSAPHLRKVACDSVYGYAAGSFSELPLLQLEEFKTISYTDDGRAYVDLLSSSSAQLRSVHCASFDFISIPTSPSTFLPNLTFLKLRAYQFISDIASHLQTLTLPSLLHLEVLSMNPETIATDRMYTSIRTLLRQSECSLEHLGFSSEASNAPALADILALSPNLVELDIDLPGVDCLQVLTIDRSPSFPRPNEALRTLIFRWESILPWVATAEERQSFVDMLKSRYAYSDQTPQEVIFVYPSETTMLQDLPSRVGNASFDDHVLGKQAWTETNVWIRFLFTTRYHSMKDWVNPWLFKKFDRLMRDLEEYIDLKDGAMGTHKLMAYGLPTFLRIVGEMGGGTIPGDRIFHFRSRAKKLLATWRPLLLRDARRYRWCHYTRGAVSLKWGVRGMGREMTEEELWNEVVGIEAEPKARNYPLLTNWRS
ncbi:hypothetical protein DFP72DRAFT_916418 [Ephemerocybe angulata]|uniref:F-box domain-containing protein n=1 Tax=Ephemerocybe angulata TaxID=980116 RepID=A0A8H6HLV7_9AGAR|nr:hypothetical protein DFP72DRAFT_916418 [Tulosesus angulatus]